MSALYRYKHIMAGAMILAIGMVLPVVFPVYFRNDDVHYIEWARAHRFQDCFSVSQGVLFGMFRPVQNLTWWVLFRCAGLNPYPYQVAVTITYLGALICYFGFVSAAISKPVAWATTGTYLVVFHFLTYIIFWFSDLTYSLELLLSHAALWCLAATVRRYSQRKLCAGLVLTFAAVMAKEPAAIIIPFTFSYLVFLNWNTCGIKQRVALAVSSISLVAAAALWILLNPSIHSRQGLSGGLLDSAWHSFITTRWEFYSSSIPKPSLLILVASALFLLTNKLATPIHSLRRRAVISLVIALGMSCFLQQMPSAALASLIAVTTLLLLFRHPAGIGIVSAIPAVLGLLTINYTVRTYLVEASFGFALMSGVALHEGFRAFQQPHLPTPSGRLNLKVLAPAACICLVAFCWTAPSVMAKFEALRLLSANRQTMAMSVKQLVNSQTKLSGPLLVVDYEDMGLTYERDILPLDDKTKAARQKTMTSDSLNSFLQPVSGITAHNLSWWNTNSPSPSVAVVLTMNPFEEDFLQSLPFRITVIQEWTHRDARARLYRIERTAPRDESDGI